LLSFILRHGNFKGYYLEILKDIKEAIAVLIKRGMPWIFKRIRNIHLLILMFYR
jgi:hypothetical protein